MGGFSYFLGNRKRQDEFNYYELLIHKKTEKLFSVYRTKYTKM